MAERQSRTSTELDTKPNVKDIHTFFSDHKALLVPLFAVVHSAEYALLSWHRLQGALHHGDVSLRKIVVPWSVGQRDQREKQRTKLD